MPQIQLLDGKKIDFEKSIPTQPNRASVSAAVDLSYIRDWTPRTFPDQEQQQPQQPPSSAAMDDFRRSVNDAASIRDELYLTLDP